MTAWTSPPEERYYGLSRCLYREAVACARRSSLAQPTRTRLLDACEHAIQRLADNPDSSRPVRRWLYRELQDVYALEDRPLLCATLRRGIETAAALLERRSGAPCCRGSRPNSRGKLVRA